MNVPDELGRDSDAKVHDVKVSVRGPQALLPLVVIGAVLMMVVPLPPVMLDVFLAVNITLGVLTLLAVVYLSDSLELSVFPSLLLVATLVRLALNVSSTRLILIDGYAGKVIEAFGSFVIGSSVVVGLVVFLILVVIQFVVITNGAGRVAEVAARFTLDAMPGKQMAIDADLGAGLIDEKEAKKRREELSREADFFGAMDGASKFVKGDAIAGIVIVVINLLGGFAIGMGTHGMPFGEAVSTYSLLTVGDGLVSQVPALLVSLATGLLVTRVRSTSDLSSDLHTQLFASPQALRVSAMVAGGFALLPGLPKLPFLILGGLLWLASTKSAADQATAADEKVDDEPVLSPDDPAVLVAEFQVEPLELQLSYDILDLFDPAAGGDLLDRVRALRRQIAGELGLVMPYVRTRDESSLPPSTYRVLLRGVEVGRGIAPRSQLLALPAGDGRDLERLGGTEVVEPVFGLPAWWVPEENKAAVSATGATVVDRSSAVVTHLAEIVRSSAAELLSRQDVQLLVDSLREESPLLAGEVGTDHLPLASLHAVMRALLEEGVPIRDISRIVEAASTAARESQRTEDVVAAVRVAVGASIVDRVAEDGKLSVVTLDPNFEAAAHQALHDIDGRLSLVLDPAHGERLRVGLVRTLETHRDQQLPPLALVCSRRLRRPLKQVLVTLGADLPALAYDELPANVEVFNLGAVGGA